MNGDKLFSALKARGYSLTNARLRVFEALAAKESQSMAELIKRLTGKVDRASVYRVIALFEMLGIVERIQIGWKYKLELSGAFSYHHHHLTCTNCGRDVPIHENSSLEHNIQMFLTMHGFSKTEHQVEIRGLCQNCQTQSLETKGLPVR